MAARVRAASAKHSSPAKHLAAPGHSPGPQVSARQLSFATDSGRSASSPVIVVPDHLVRNRRSAANDLVGRASNSMPSSWASSSFALQR